jgi:hypothetical protein
MGGGKHAFEGDSAAAVFAALSYGISFVWFMYEVFYAVNTAFLRFSELN